MWPRTIAKIRNGLAPLKSLPQAVPSSEGAVLLFLTSCQIPWSNVGLAHSSALTPPRQTPNCLAMCYCLAMRWRQGLLFFLLVLPGVCGFVFCMYYALLDWAELQKAYTHFAEVARTSKEISTLFVAESRQNIHRINLFADVVWALMGAILAAIGLHGLCVSGATKS